MEAVQRAFYFHLGPICHAVHMHIIKRGGVLLKLMHLLLALLMRAPGMFDFTQGIYSKCIVHYSINSKCV